MTSHLRSPGSFPSWMWAPLRRKNFRRCPVSRRCSACTRSANGLRRELGPDRRRGASTADAMRMLTLPSTFGLYLAAMAAAPATQRPGRRRAVGRDGGSVRARRGRHRGVVDPVDGRLGGPRRASGAHRQRVVAAEAVRARTLSPMGVPVEELIVNQVLVQDDSYEYRNLPDHPAFDWYAERIAEQRPSSTTSPPSPGGRTGLVPHPAGEPIGPKAVGELLDCARRRGTAAPPGPLRAVVDLESGTGLGSVYRMRLELPQVDTGYLTLGRVDDDLIIGVGGMRRRVRLASVLAALPR